MSVEDRDGAQALVYLDRLGLAANSDPAVLLLQSRTLALNGQCSDAARLLAPLEAQANGGPSVPFSAGLALAECHLYAQAEEFFTRALDADPGNFDALYNLGLAALEAAHADRATSVLEAARRQRPEDTDCLYALSRAYLKQERLADAVALLAKAQKLAPEQTEVLLLLAEVSFRIEFYEDAAAAYAEAGRRRCPP